MYFIPSIVNRFTSKELKAISSHIAKSITLALSTLILLNSPVVTAQEVNFKAKNEQYLLQLTAPQSPALNTIYRWKAVISSAQQLNNISLSNITISGGMAAHGHGLPTQPKALNLNHDTDNQISFDIQGLKFQMWGKWHVKVSVSEDSVPLIVDFELTP
jgi:hypothetical protein